MTSTPSNAEAEDLCLLFPADPLAPARCDPHFRPEFVAARAMGLGVVVFDDTPLHQDGQAMPDLGSLLDRTVVYRGWMLTGDEYRRLAEALHAAGAELLTVPDAYEEAHYLPGWYEAFSRHTPISVWSEEGGADPSPLLQGLPAGPAIVKDWSKSMKHLWEEACFIPDVRDEVGALMVIDRFRELRGDDLHGLVLRHFEELGDEYRSWWVDGEMRLLTAHPDTPELSAPEADLSFLAEDVGRLEARAVTVDVAETDDGWRVIEVGDAMVSDRPESCGPQEFLRALFLP